MLNQKLNVDLFYPLHTFQIEYLLITVCLHCTCSKQIHSIYYSAKELLPNTEDLTRSHITHIFVRCGYHEFSEI